MTVIGWLAFGYETDKLVRRSKFLDASSETPTRGILRIDYPFAFFSNVSFPSASSLARTSSVVMHDEALLSFISIGSRVEIRRKMLKKKRRNTKLQKDPEVSWGSNISLLPLRITEEVTRYLKWLSKDSIHFCFPFYHRTLSSPFQFSAAVSVLFSYSFLLSTQITSRGSSH